MRVGVPARPAPHHLAYRREHTMKLFLILLRTSRRMALLTIFFGALSGASSAALLGLINNALTQSTSPLPELALPFAGIALAALVTRITSQLLLNRLQQGILMDLRLRLSRHLISTSLRTLEEAGAHRAHTSLGQDILTLSMGMSMLPEMFINAAVILGSLGYMMWLSWPLCLAIIGFILVGQFLYAIPASLAMKHQQLAREQNSVLTRCFFALTNGAKELRLNRDRRHEFIDGELQPTVQQVRKHFLRSDSLFALANGWGMFAFVFVIGLFLFMMPRLTDLPAPVLHGSVLLLLYIQQPINSITGMMPHLSRGNVALAQLEQLGLKLVPETSVQKALPAGMRERPRSLEKIELVGLTHSYGHDRDDEKFTLGPISTSLNRGELIFLVGGNGSGKTTLAKLMTGLYSPEGGEIRVDGRRVQPEELDEYRQHFSAVFFDFFLFERLLGIASPELLQQARHYLEQLHLDQKVRIDEQGRLSNTALSQGQRKRLALLAAYLEDRPVYMFDEWAADQDPMFKEVFYKKLLPDLRGRGKTVLVISHDDRYFHLADRVLRLESGQLIADTRPGESRASA